MIDGPLLTPGTLVDHFKVGRLVGKGGMGEVYLARDTLLGRRVALKLLHENAIGSSEATRRFLSEARITARFSHPHIITIHGVGQHAGRPYVALEYLEGQSLRQRVNEARPSVRESVRIALAIAEALREAHGHKILHRDLKPENVMIPRDGRLRVLDFGLAKEMEGVLPPPGDAGDLNDSETLDPALLPFESGGHGICGTPAYMAPEQWHGRPCSGATDIWALGIILWELLAGRHPFLPQLGAGRLALALRVCQGEVPALAEEDLPPALVGLVAGCLRQEPESRPSAEAVVAELEALLGRTQGLTLEEQPPFPGLLPFSEREADRFYGREPEVAAFLEKIRQHPVIPVVGPSGAGKSSFVQAGVLPRLREQGRWIVLRLRPGSQPLRVLAARLLQQDSRRSSSFPPVAPGAPDPALAQTEGVPDSSDPTAAPAGPEPAATRAASRTEASSDPGGTIPAQAEAEQRLQQDLLGSPARLALELARLAEQERCKVLLFVDQLEEVCTLVEDAAVRQAFLDAVCLAADDPDGPVRVVFTLRDDFLGRVSGQAAVRDVLRSVVVLGTPDRLALREIVVRPVERSGYRYEDAALVEEMVAAVAGEAGSLPLLQFACTALWDKRDVGQRLLARQAYQAIGGVAGALARHADGLLQGLSAAQERLARSLLLRLVGPQRTRLVRTRPDMLEGLGPEAEQVLTRLTDGRVVMAYKRHDAVVLELTHESLIQSWDRLRSWVHESSEERAFLAEVEQAAALWVKRGRLLEEVWSGAALQEAARRASQCRAVPATVHQFLTAGQVRQRRSERLRLTALVTGFAVLGLVALGLGLLAQQASRARDEATRAQHRSSEHLAAALAEKAEAALAADDALSAEVLAAASLQLDERADARGVALRATNGWRPQLVRQVTAPPGLDVDSVEMSPSWWIDVREGGLVATSTADPGKVRRLASQASKDDRLDISPDELLLSTAGKDGILHLWSLTTLKPLHDLEGLAGELVQVRWSPDSQRLAALSRQSVVVWDVATGRVLGRLRELAGTADRGVALSRRPCQLFVGDCEHGALGDYCSGTVAPKIDSPGCRPSFSHDGRLLAGGGSNGVVRVVEVESGAKLAEFQGHTSDVTMTAFSADGATLATASTDRTAALWHLPSGRLRARFPGGADRKRYGIRFSEDQRWLWITDGRGSSRTWDVSSADPAGILAFAHDARSVAVGGGHGAWGDAEGEVGVWDLETRRVVARFALPGELGISQVLLSPDGATVLAGQWQDSATLWRVAGGEPNVRLDGGCGLALSSDGRRIATGEHRSRGSRVRLFDWLPLQGPAVLAGHTTTTCGLAFSPDGQLLATGDTDRTVRVWSVAERTLLHEMKMDVWGTAWRLAFSPDGTLLASVGDEHVVRLWDPRTGKPLRKLEGHTNRIRSLAFSPSGELLATGSFDGSIRLWGMPEGRLRAILPVGKRSVDGLAFAKEHELVSAAGEEGLRSWDLASLDAPGEALAARAQRDLGLTVDGVAIVAR